MGAAELIPGLTVENYLAWEAEQDERYEYVAGCVYAMSGGSINHARIVNNLVRALDRAVAGGPCDVFSNATKLRTQALESELFYYPDIMVSCDPEDNHALYRERPTILIEVLSPSTRRVHSREKLWTYIAIPSVQEVVLVEQDAAKCVLHTRSGQWLPQEVVGLEADLLFASINLAVPLAEVYQRVEW